MTARHKQEKLLRLRCLKGEGTQRHSLRNKISEVSKDLELEDSLERMEK